MKRERGLALAPLYGGVEVVERSELSRVVAEQRKRDRMWMESSLDFTFHRSANWWLGEVGDGSEFGRSQSIKLKKKKHLR